jgi:uncharacterized membrane protein YphA (DoxX/SURF4 family)
MTPQNKAKRIYWLLTAPFLITMLIAGVTMLAGVAANVEGVTHLGYPAYLCKILGVAKLCGGLAILHGRWRTLKEWAYAGYTFNLFGASASHAFSGDPFGKIIAPVIILAFVLASYRQWRKNLAAALAVDNGEGLVAATQFREGCSQQAGN